MHEVWDGTYSFEDLLDWFDLQAIKEENRNRYQQWIDALRGARGY